MSNQVSCTPVLDDLLNLDETNLETYVVDVNTIGCEPESALSSYRLKSLKLAEPSGCVAQILESDFEPSTDLADYFEVLTVRSNSSNLESFGCENSLFLAVARSILFKIYSIDRKYKYIIKKIYAAYLGNGLDAEFKFNSDMKLQEAIRKSLCIYWLGFVFNGQFIGDCKYSRCFENACDFIYQVYQLSVNNFCNNRLFNQFALEDLAELLRVRIVVFETNQPPSDDHERDSGVEVSLSRPRVRVFEPKKCQNSPPILNDSIYIKLDHLEKIKFKWLMPTRLQFNLEKSRLLSSSWSNSNFFKLKPGYIRYRILLDQESLRQRFDAEFINNSVNFALFLRFLCECSVHTLVSLDELKFERLIQTKDSSQFIDYLNKLWGQEHFSLKEILNQIQFNNELERIQKENKNFIQEVFKYNSTMTSSRCGQIRVPDEPSPIDYSLKKSPSEHDTVHRRSSVSDSLSSNSASRLMANLYQMSNCFRDDHDQDEPDGDKNKNSKSSQDIFSSSTDCSTSPSSILESWKTLTIPLMNSLMAQNVLVNSPAESKPTRVGQKRSLTWCLDSLMSQAGELKRDSSNNLTQ